MKMEAINRVQGVKVLVGKGKGTKNAFAGDIFECNESEAERLMSMDAAKEYSVKDRLAGLDDDDEKAAPKKAAPKKPAGKKPATKTSEPGKGSEKAADGSDTASDEDLGL